MKITEIWRDPVWSKVIASAILAIIGLIYSFWPALLNHTKDFLQFLQVQQTLPRWHLYILNFLASVFIVIMAIIVWSYIKTEKAIANKTYPSWYKYNCDNFFEIKWRWNYTENSITNLNTFCPHCDYQIYPRMADRMFDNHNLGLVCDSCNNLLKIPPESISELENKVKRHIQKKIRNWNKDEST